MLATDQNKSKSENFFLRLEDVAAGNTASISFNPLEGDKQMLTVLTKYNWKDHRDRLEQMYRLRHKVLYEKLGWNEVYSDDGIDKDQNDHEDTIYLVGNHPACSQVISCVRFAPSTFPTLSNTVFRDMFDVKPLPEGPGYYDASRIVVDLDTLFLCRRSSPTGELTLGWLEAGMALGIEAFTGIAEVKKFRKWVALGWSILPMGLPRNMGGSEVVAVKITPTQDAIERTRERFGIDHPVIDESGIANLKRYHNDYLANLSQQKAA